MTPQEEKYLIASQERILNTVLNIHAESRATKELLILLAGKILTFPEGQTAEKYWQACFDSAFSELRQRGQSESPKQT